MDKATSAGKIFNSHLRPNNVKYVESILVSKHQVIENRLFPMMFVYVCI